MKTILKKAAFSLTGVLLGTCAIAQTVAPDANYVKPFSGDDAFRTWSIGVHVGALSTYTPLQNNSRQDFMTTQAQLGYGAYIKKQITPSFGIQADYLGGKIEAANSAMRGAPFNNSAYTKVSTTVQYAASLSAHFNLSNLNWHFKSTGIQPYFTAGVGLMSYTPFLTPSDGNPSIYFNDKDNHSVQELFVPVGAGFKLNVAKGVNIDLGYKVAFVNSDNIDGYNYGANNDRFSYGHIGLEFALGAKSKPQLATHNPVNSLRNEYLMEEQRLQMAIDAQKAAIDAQKAANDQLRADLNATNANLAKFSADSDGDGVPDFFDKCPATPSGTKVDGSGCPLPVAAAPRPDVRVIVTEQDRRIVNEAIKNLEFDFGKSTIRAKSFPSLDRVAALLVEKNFSLKLAGHTDNVGSNDANLNLSKNRAEAVKTYLVGKGANASRIEATGYGETQPIATNKTAAGRQKNRRVEFTLF
jgi:OmpA-OmpF porin, OOP family